MHGLCTIDRATQWRRNKPVMRARAEAERQGLTALYGFDQAHVRAAFAGTCAAHGVTPQQLIRKSRVLGPVQAARRALITALYDPAQGYGLSEVARIVGRTHSTVLHHLRVAGILQTPGRPEERG